MSSEIRFALQRMYSRHAYVAAYVVLGVAIGAFAMSLVVVVEPYRLLFTLPAFQNVGAPSAYALSSSTPIRLRIEKFGIDAPIEEVGLNPDKSVAVPTSYDAVGWYSYGPTPGELGPAVLLGHVDSLEGTAVFGKIYALEPGDTIVVDRRDGTAEFVVEAVKMYSQNDFPTEEVYGDIKYAGLRLITCAGYYDHGTLRYSHNVVVYAKLEVPE